MHDVDPYNHGMDGYCERMHEVLDGALPALHELRRAGIVRAIGVAVNDCSVCLDFLQHAEVDAFLLAGRYTLLDQEAAEELLPQCLRRGIGVIVISSELPEIIGTCDRVLVMREGRLVGEVGGAGGAPITQENIMAYGAGAATAA